MNKFNDYFDGVKQILDREANDFKIIEKENNTIEELKKKIEELNKANEELKAQ